QRGGNSSLVSIPQYPIGTQLAPSNVCGAVEEMHDHTYRRTLSSSSTTFISRLRSLIEMRCLATLSCIFTVFISVASAASIHIRDAQAEAQPDTTGSVVARQNALVTFEDAGETMRDCTLPHSVKLTRGTKYELNFYEESDSGSISRGDCIVFASIGGRMIWKNDDSKRSTTYQKRTSRFIWDQEEENGVLRFTLLCNQLGDGYWRLDDVSLKETSDPID
ncbi:hypothetical protein DL96DRAFT_1740010, partial [Flagelloscypha sp. PMI_526]